MSEATFDAMAATQEMLAGRLRDLGLDDRRDDRMEIQRLSAALASAECKLSCLRNAFGATLEDNGLPGPDRAVRDNVIDVIFDFRSRVVIKFIDALEKRLQSGDDPAKVIKDVVTEAKDSIVYVPTAAEAGEDVHSQMTESRERHLTYLRDAGAKINPDDHRCRP